MFENFRKGDTWLHNIGKSVRYWQFDAYFKEVFLIPRVFMECQCSFNFLPPSLLRGCPVQMRPIEVNDVFAKRDVWWDKSGLSIPSTLQTSIFAVHFYFSDDNDFCFHDGRPNV